MRMRELLVILCLVFTLVVIALTKKSLFHTSKANTSDFALYILEDLRTKHPHADDIRIVSVEPFKNNTKVIKAAVSYGLHTLCPNLTLYYYIYPTRFLYNHPPEVVVKGCKICDEPPCMVLFKEQAIIASYKGQGKAKEVEKFIKIHHAYPFRVSSLGGGYWKVCWKGEDGVSLRAVVDSYARVVYIKIGC